MMRPIRMVYADGYTVEIAELESGGPMRVTVTSPLGRSWAGSRDLIEDAIALALQILVDQREQAGPSAAESEAAGATLAVVGEQVALAPPQAPPHDVERQIVGQVTPLA